MKKIIIVLSIILVLGLAVGIGSYLSPVKVLGSAPSGLQAQLATTSTIAVGPDKPNVASTTVSVFTGNTICASRVITTVGQPISLQFSNSMISSTTANASATTGHEQLASTTVVYDSGLWGCGYVSAYGYGATTTITISEFR